MEKFIKPSFILGGLIGFIFGVLLLIPFIAPLMFLLIFFVAGIAIIVILKRNNSIGIISLQDGCLIGAIAGFSSLVATAVIYIPVSFFISSIFKGYLTGFSISKSLALTGYDLMVIFMLVTCTAVLSSIMNAFSGMLTAFFYQKIEKKSTNFEEHLYMEQIDEIVE